MNMILSTCVIVFALILGTTSARRLSNHRVPLNTPVEQELFQLSESNNDFGMRLLNALERKVLEPESNIVLSSYSISTVLTMVGASGDTYRQLFNTLGFFQNQSLLNIMEAHHKLHLELNRKVADTSISSANAIAKKKSLTILRHYQTALETYFDSSVFPAEAQWLNEWVSKKTNGKINQIFDDDSSVADAVLILLNAVYFKGTWEYKFIGGTDNFEFHVRKDYNKTVKMMSVRAPFEYSEFDDGQLVKLPYRDQYFSMLVFLPHNHTHTPLSSMFTSHSLSTRIAQLKQEDVCLHLPKFRIESNYQLKDTLGRLGIVDAFDPILADFFNITDSTKLHVSEVLHKTVINVNEHGTEAVAVTAISMHESMPTIMFVDRPFMFFIRDDRTRAILFSGVIYDPQG